MSQGLSNADPGMGVASSIAGIGSNGMGYDSVEGWGDNPHANRAVFACGVLKTGAGVLGAGLNAGVPGAGTAVAIGVGVVTDAITNGIAAYDSHKAVAALKALPTKYSKLQNPTVGEYKQLRDIIDYCAAKRTSRRDRQISKAAAVGAGVSIYQGVKALHKIRMGTKGVARAANADALYELAKRPGEVGAIATAIVQIIAGNSFDGLLKAAIKDGMKSTA